MSLSATLLFGAFAAVVVIGGIGSMYLNYERWKHEDELRDLEERSRKNAQKIADIIEVNEDKIAAAHTGDHRADLATMGEQLHDLAKRRKNKPGNPSA